MGTLHPEDHPVLGALALAASSASHEQADAALHGLDERPAVKSDLRHAEIEMYCDHDDLALQALRSARTRLQSEAVPPVPACESLAEVSWHLRHHDHVAAAAALQRVYHQLDA